MAEYGERSSVGRAPDCDSGGRGFEPHRSPQSDQKLEANSQLIRLYDENARVAELVDALDLGSSGVTRESSSLSFRTRFN